MHPACGPERHRSCPASSGRGHTVPRKPRVSPNLAASFVCVPKQITYSLEASMTSSVEWG